MGLVNPDRQTQPQGHSIGPYESDGTVAMWKRTGRSLDFEISALRLGSYPFQGHMLAAPVTYFVLHPEALAAVIDRAQRGPNIFILRLPSSVNHRRAAMGNGRLRYVVSGEHNHFVEFNSSFEAYLSKFSANSRATLRRKLRRFASASGGEIEWRTFSTAAELAEFHAIATELSDRTWQETSGFGGLESEADSETLQALARLQGAKGYILFLHGRAIAYECFLRYGKSLLSLVRGYDPQHRDHAPGDVVMLLILEKLFESREFSYLDFGWNDLWYKKFFSTGSIYSTYELCLPRTFKSLALVRAHASLARCTHLVGNALDAVNLRDRIRNILRGDF